MENRDILNNKTNLNETVDRVLETLSNIDLPDYSQGPSTGRFGEFLDATANLKDYVVDSELVRSVKQKSNEVLGHKYVKTVREKTNNLISSVGTYSMILALPLSVFAVISGGVGSILLAPIILGGGFAMRIYGKRQNSIIKKVSNFSKKQLSKLKDKTKQIVRTKSLQKSVAKLTYHDEKTKISKDKQKINNQILASRQVSFLKQQIGDRIIKFDKIYTNILNSAEKQDENVANSNIEQLKIKGIDTILQLKINIEQLNSIKASSSNYNTEINSVAKQCDDVIVSIIKNLGITNEMIRDRYQKILENNERMKEEAPSNVIIKKLTRNREFSIQSAPTMN